MEKTVKFPESTPMKQFLKNTIVQSAYYIYPVKFDFERGSGTENHEIYYFINYTHDFWIFIIELHDVTLHWVLGTPCQSRLTEVMKVDHCIALHYLGNTIVTGTCWISPARPLTQSL